MKNRRYALLGLLLAGVVGLCWCTGRHVFRPLPPEPMYGGIVAPSAGKSGMDVFFDGGYQQPVYEVHPLGYWLTRQYVFPMGDGYGVLNSATYNPLPTALLNDSNAVPFLIKALRRDSWVGQAYYRKWLWPKLPAGMRAHLPNPPADNWQIRETTAGLLGRMGPLGKPAIPALGRALKEDESYNVRLMAAVALGYLGRGDKAAMAALKVGFQDTNLALRFVATNALISIDRATAAKTLRESTNWIVRRVATCAMIAMDLQTAIDALKGSEDEDIRKLAADTLANSGKGNAAAVAALAAALDDRGLSVRKAATNALLKIDPEAAAKAGVKTPPP
jgi:hypothetical protein